MLKNAYFLAKIGADTAENEQHFAEICQKLATTRQSARLTPRLTPARVHAVEAALAETALGSRPEPCWRAGRGRGSKMNNISKICQLLQICGGLVLGRIDADFCK